MYWFSAVTLFILFTYAAGTQALVVVPVDLGQLAQMSPVIVHGTVGDVRPQLALDRRRVDTFVSLDVSAYVKGNLGAELVFRVPGGQFGRYRTIVPGAPSFEPGDEVVLFLGTDGPSVPHIVGLSQGVFRVAADAQTGEKRVLTPPMETAPSANERPQPVVRGDLNRRPMAVAQFLSAVRALTGRGAARGIGGDMP